jgi:hypothetical protein
MDGHMEHGWMVGWMDGWAHDTKFNHLDGASEVVRVLVQEQEPVLRAVEVATLNCPLHELGRDLWDG